MNRFAQPHDIIEKLREVIDLPQNVIALELDIPEREANSLPVVRVEYHPDLAYDEFLKKVTKR